MVFFIFLGGFFGAITRFFLAKTIGKAWEKSFPMGTFVINITGSFLLGFLLTVLAGNRFWPEYIKMGITVGYIGAYTTFSTFSYEGIQMLQDREWVNTLAYVFLSLIIALLMTWLGIEAAKLI